MKLLVSDSEFLKKIPSDPGVYRFYTDVAISNHEIRDQSEEQLLYIGKAISLRKRVKSYFQKSSTLSPRISLMVKKITKIEITVTDNETSALILENNLIKSLKPKYNIIFRDDKTYPLIRVSHDDFPRIDSYRGKVLQSSQYFGPYPNVQAMRYTLDMIQRLFKIRTCADSMFRNRSRPCMLHQINRCTAPCVNLVTKEEYHKQINFAIEFLRGNYKKIIIELNDNMMKAADSEDFEAAAEFRDEIGLIKSMTNNQIINDYKRPVNTDLIIVKEYERKVFIYLIMVRGGVYVSDNHFVLDNPDNDLDDIFRIFIENYYFLDLTKSTTHYARDIFEIYTKVAIRSEIIEVLSGKIKINNILTTALSKLHIMGEDNLERIIMRSLNVGELVKSAKHLSILLEINDIFRMECIDVSHNQGQNTIASLVVYENGSMNNKAYRRYNLNVDRDGNKINGNDLLAFEVVLSKRLENKDWLLPNIILVDGGYNQLNVAKNVLQRYGLSEKIIAIAIFKGENRNPLKDSLILPNQHVIPASDDILLFKLLHVLRDEAHRFAITGHRKKEVKRMSSSQLDDIPNIGLKKKQALIAHFGSSKNVANASLKDLEMVDGIGSILAKQVYEYFHGVK